MLLKVRSAAADVEYPWLRIRFAVCANMLMSHATVGLPLCGIAAR
jgi:hypothetical protein